MYRKIKFGRYRKKNQWTENGENNDDRQIDKELYQMMSKRDKKRMKRMIQYNTTLNSVNMKRD